MGQKGVLRAPWLPSSYRDYSVALRHVMMVAQAGQGAQTRVESVPNSPSFESELFRTSAPGGSGREELNPNGIYPSPQMPDVERLVSG